MMEPMWLDTLLGLCSITSSGGWATLRGLASSTSITTTSRGIRRCRLIGSKNCFKETKSREPSKTLVWRVALEALLCDKHSFLYGINDSFLSYDQINKVYFLWLPKLLCLSSPISLFSFNILIWLKSTVTWLLNRVIYINAPQCCAIVAVCTLMFKKYHSCPPKVLKTYRYAPSVTICKKNILN